MANTPLQSDRIEGLEGVHYHSRSKSLHIRLEDHGVLPQVITLLRSSSKDSLLPLHKCESLHLSIGVNFMVPPRHHHHPAHARNIPQSQQQQQQQQEQNAHYFRQLCQAVGECLSNLTEIQVNRALAGFVFTSAGAGCPVEALQLLLHTHAHLETLMLGNLLIYSSAVGEETPSSNAPSAVQLLGHSLKGHSSLQRFGWQQCTFVASHSDDNAALPLDPLLESLSTLPKLTDCVVQSPPWFPLVPTTPQILRNLVRPAMKGLHLAGLQLQDEHLQSLLVVADRSCSSLQRLSLSLHFTVDNIHHLANTLSRVLIQNRSNLQELSLRLDWLDDTLGGDNGAPSKRRQRQRLQALQSFQDTIGRSLLPNNHNDSSSSSRPPQLERLELVYFDDATEYHYNSTTKTNTPAPLICPGTFLQVLEHNFSLTHLRLPYCGEMHPRIGFFLKLNRTGLRQLLLLGGHDDDDDDDDHPTIIQNQRAQGVAAMLKVQERPEQCWSPASSTSTDTTALSMMYYLLRELPGMFQ